MSGILFIGGCRDGKRFGVPRGERYLRVPYRLPEDVHPINFKNPDETTCVIMRVHVYRMERLRSGDTEWNFYVLDTLSTVDALDALLNGYSPKSAPESEKPKRQGIWESASIVLRSLQPATRLAVIQELVQTAGPVPDHLHDQIRGFIPH